MGIASRYAIVAPLAGVVTIGLFYFMERLVEMADMKLSKKGAAGQIDFVRLKRESSTQKKKRELPQKAVAKAQPKAPQMDLPNVSAPAAGSIAVSAPKAEVDVKMTGALALGAAPSDGEATPVVRVDPVYPQSMRSRGIEGWVVLKFDINKNGAVANPRVTDSQPKRVFDDAAIAAVRKWKYKPKILDGKAVVQRGITVRLKFELSE